MANATETDPRLAEAEAAHRAGIAAYQSGKPQVAMQLLERSLGLAPQDAGYHCNLGVVLDETGNAEAAIACYRRAAQLDPNLYEAHLKLAHALARRGQLAEACAALSAAIQLRPRLAAPVTDLGVLLGRLGHLEQALVCYRQALAIDAKHAAAHSNMAGALVALGRFAEAIGSARSALALDPGDVGAVLNLGNAFKEQGRLSDAAECYDVATKLTPSDARPWNNLAEVRRDQGRVAEAAGLYEQALAIQPDHAAAWSNLLYLHAFAHDLPAEKELALARGWERAMLTEVERTQARRDASASSGVFPRTAREGRKLRLGIVSAELGTHAVAEFLQPFLEQLDRERFHLTLLPTVGRTDARAGAVRALAEEWLPLMGLSDAAAVENIRQRELDVLIDTSGHTTGNRLGIFARRAAPVQCTWIGYWSTTGLTEMDYAIADSVAPPGAERYFSETLWRLERPNGRSPLKTDSPLNVCYRGDASLAIDWQPDADGTIWLGSLNKFSKVREETIALWAGALRELPGARLLLEDRGTDETESRLRIQQGFARHGIGPEQIAFVPYVPGHERHMLLYNRLDIALDTLPFNSGTTAFDALWMGAPLVTVEGDWTGGRIAGGVLRALDRPEWIAGDATEFAQIVRELGRDVERRRQLRASQRAEMAASSLCDAEGLTRAVEAALMAMHDRWLQDG